jgi:hypothetical protein
MAFAHCHDCDFSQDDFWEVYGNGWHPFRSDIVQDWIRHINDAIHGRKTISMDIWWAKDAGISYREVGGHAEINVLEYIAWELEHKAKNIRNMHWLTTKEFRDDPNRCCPKCGSKHLDID